MDDIRAALESDLATFVTDVDLAFENVPYEPVPGTPYIQVQFLPTSRRPLVRGPNPQQRYQGLFSLTVCTPTYQGSGTAWMLADSLLGHYDASTVVAGVAADVTIEYSETGTAFTREPFYCLPVNIGWFAHAT